MLAELPPLGGLVAGNLEEAMIILVAALASMLASATMVAVVITALCVRWCRREGGARARILSAAWGLVLVGAVVYAWGRMTDMTLDPAQGDFWWSAWMTIGGLGNAVVAFGGALLGQASGRAEGGAADHGAFGR